MRALVVVLATAGCFSPSPEAGLPCAPDGWCPSPQKCVAGICGGSGAAVDAGTADAPVVSTPHVFASPGPAPTYFVAWAAPIPVTLASEDTAAQIYYTTNGSVPTTSSSHGATPVDVMLSASAQLGYVAIDGASASNNASQTYDIDTTKQNDYGYLVYHVTLGGTSPVMVVAPGQTVSVNLGYLQVWSSSTPQNGAQLVYSVDNSYQGCAFDGTWSSWPGTIRMNVTFNITAPTTPGEHDVRLTHIYDGNCATALADSSLPSRPTVAQIAVLLVH